MSVKKLNKKVSKKTPKYKFSFVMPIYNVEKYLDETVQSILNQTMDFEENCEIIFINDGSPDNSEEICLKYQKQYPNNITYIKQDNKGVSVARNRGLKSAKGKYISFLDSDDRLSVNTLRGVWDFIEAHSEEIDMVSVPLYHFEAVTGIHAKYELFGEENRIIDLEEEPYNIVLSASSSFYKSNIFEYASFKEGMKWGEDAVFNLGLYAKNKKIGYVCEDDIKYEYRKRYDQNSANDAVKKDPEAFRTIVEYLNFAASIRAELGEIFDEVVIYELRARLSNIRRSFFDSEKEYEDIIESYRGFIDMVDRRRLAGLSPFLPTRGHRYLFLSNILRDESALDINNNMLVDRSSGAEAFPVRNLPVHLKNLNVSESNITAEILFFDFNLKNCSVKIVDDDGQQIELSKMDKFSSPYDIRYGEFNLSKTSYFKFTLPKYTKSKYSIMVGNDLDGWYNAKVQLHRLSPHWAVSRWLESHRGGVRVRVLDNKITIAGKSTWLSYKKADLITQALYFRRHAKLLPLRLLSRRNKQYILFNDRPNKAQDNAEALFRYINENHPNIAKYTYFVLSASSPDYKKLKQVGKVVAKNSLKHKYLFLNARHIVSSHLFPGFINAFGKKERFYRDLFDYKYTWIQHGVNMNQVQTSVNRLNQLQDRTLVSTPHEYREFRSRGYFFEDEHIIKTGLPRFDQLANSPQNIITVMPTWRYYLTGAIQDTGEHDSKEGFENTDYFKAFHSLLSNKKLINSAGKAGYKIQFALHPGLAAYADIFKDLESDVVKIIRPSEVDYAEIFKTSKLLVTDYSSVFFDFSYLKKPVLFFQFDKQDFFSGHYKKGLFDYETMGTGLVVETVDELVEQVVINIRNKCAMQPEYINRLDKLFYFGDKNNSRRVFQSIVELDHSYYINKTVNKRFRFKLRNSRAIKTYYYRYRYPEQLNFGDEITAYLVWALWRQKVLWASEDEADLLSTGSVLEFGYKRTNTDKLKVWGSGFIRKDDLEVNKNLEYYAVRGKLTLDRLGIDKNIPLGDPGLLVSRVISGSKIKTHKIGLVAHYIDQDLPLVNRLAASKNVLLIDPLDTPDKVARDITSCEIVLSSSLHGLIFADSYGIPNYWMPLSDRVVGGDYKFKDYYSATGRELRSVKPSVFDDEGEINRLIDEYIPVSNLKKIQDDLIATFPFPNGVNKDRPLYD